MSFSTPAEIVAQAERAALNKISLSFPRTLVAAMLVGRLVSGVTKALFFMAGQYTMQAWIAASFVTALPGIVLQLAVVPSIVYYLMRAGLIPQRYPR